MDRTEILKNRKRKRKKIENGEEIEKCVAFFLIFFSLKN